MTEATNPVIGFDTPLFPFFGSGAVATGIGGGDGEGSSYSCSDGQVSARSALPSARSGRRGGLNDKLTGRVLVRC